MKIVAGDYFGKKIEMLEASGAGCASVKLGKYIIVVTTEDNYESENFKCK